MARPAEVLDGVAPEVGRLLTVDDAAEFPDVPVRFVRRIIHERRIASVRPGRHVHLAVQDTHLMEDIEAAGYGQPPVDDCVPDEDGIVWF